MCVASPSYPHLPSLGPTGIPSADKLMIPTLNSIWHHRQICLLARGQPPDLSMGAVRLAAVMIFFRSYIWEPRRSPTWRGFCGETREVKVIAVIFPLLVLLVALYDIRSFIATSTFYRLFNQGEY